ncbi:hypothetical protein [Mesorhizobium sp. M0968]|uniref:hypothetical protein n=1 Tax=unclassified Mesorhizobium TaxID=325217 RepID=UPI003335D3C5
MDHGGPLADHEGAEALDAAAAHNLVESAEETLLAIGEALCRDLVGFVDDEMQRRLVSCIEIFQKRRQESVLLAAGHLRSVDDGLDVAFRERQG